VNQGCREFNELLAGREIEGSFGSQGVFMGCLDVDFVAELPEKGG
jgi:hypothetical protein